MGASACSDCKNEFQSEINSPGGKWNATIYVRQCGSAEGWIVKLGKGESTTEVFQALMPHPTSVEHAKDLVKVRWLDDNNLVISSPEWASVITDVDVEGLTIKHERTDVGYPIVDE